MAKVGAGMHSLVKAACETTLRPVLGLEDDVAGLFLEDPDPTRFRHPVR